jgi:hypothetical protein
MEEPWTDAGVIETYTGTGFDLLDPSPADVRLVDIAAGLAHTCRFGGHCDQFYSVAQHSLHVSEQFESDRLRTVALFHDAAEAYMGDVPRPFKSQYDLFEEVESEILATVWEALGVEPPTDDEWSQVMEADDQLLAYEAQQLLEDGSWAADPRKLGYDLRGRDIAEVRDQFAARGESLLSGI